MKLTNGKQSVEAITGSDLQDRSWDIGVWYFCQNGHQRTGVDISVEQFDMVKEIVTNPEVVEFYEKRRNP